MSDFFVVGVSWRTAAVAMRERLAFTDSEVQDALAELMASPVVEEALIISTCNRVEVYGTAASTVPGARAQAAAWVRSFLARSRGVPAEELSEAIYERIDTDAVSHMFRVASALDSMVVGESQILGQLKDAYGTAVRLQASGPNLSRCIERAFTVAKRVRSETAIAQGAANVSSVAVELSQHVFGDLEGRRILLVGAGKMSALAARHLRTAGAASVTVTNRSPQRAEQLAKEIEGVARDWDALEELLINADVAITSTGASQPVISRKLLKRVMKKRKYRPMVIVDIAVPRDVEAKAGDIDGLFLFDIDDLRKVVERNLSGRSKEAHEAHRIVQDEVLAFQRWLRSQKVVPTIRSLRDHFSNVASAEAEKVVAQLARDHTPEEREKAIRRLASVIVNKLLHLPMNALKENDRDVEALIKAAEKLFQLERKRAQSKAELQAEAQPESDQDPPGQKTMRRGSA